MTLPNTLEATVEEFKDDIAVLVTDDNQRLRVPKSLISENATAGGTVYLTVFSSQDAAAERDRFAKQVLNELLQG